MPIFSIGRALNDPRVVELLTDAAIDVPLTPFVQLPNHVPDKHHQQSGGCSGSHASRHTHRGNVDSDEDEDDQDIGFDCEESSHISMPSPSHPSMPGSRLPAISSPVPASR